MTYYLHVTDKRDGVLIRRPIEMSRSLDEAIEFFRLARDAFFGSEFDFKVFNENRQEIMGI